MKKPTTVKGGENLNKLKECRWCGSLYIGERSSSKYCSDSCRVQSWRHDNHNGHDSHTDEAPSITNDEFITPVNFLIQLYQHLVHMHGGITDAFRDDESGYLYEMDDYPYQDILNELIVRRRYGLTKEACEHIYKAKTGSEDYRCPITFADLDYLK